MSRKPRPGDRLPDQRASDADIVKGMFPGAAEGIEGAERRREHEPASEPTESLVTAESFIQDYGELDTFKDFTARMDLRDPEQRIVWLNSCQQRLLHIEHGDYRHLPNDIYIPSPGELELLKSKVAEALETSEKPHKPLDKGEN